MHVIWESISFFSFSPTSNRDIFLSIGFWVESFLFQHFKDVTPLSYEKSALILIFVLLYVMLTLRFPFFYFNNLNMILPPPFFSYSLFLSVLFVCLFWYVSSQKIQTDTSQKGHPSCSTSLVTRKMQTKTTMGNHYILRRITQMKRWAIPNIAGNWNNWNSPMTLVSQCWLPLYIMIWQYLSKLSIYLSHNNAVHLLDIYPTRMHA